MEEQRDFILFQMHFKMKNNIKQHSKKGKNSNPLSQKRIPQIARKVLFYI